jgi:hypothetical protein
MVTTKELQGVRYYYKQNDHTIELHFVDNKLIRKVDHFGETPAPEEGEQRRMMPHPSSDAPPKAPATPTPQS